MRPLYPFRPLPEASTHSGRKLALCRSTVRGRPVPDGASSPCAPFVGYRSSLPGGASSRPFGGGPSLWSLPPLVVPLVGSAWSPDPAANPRRCLWCHRSESNEVVAPFGLLRALSSGPGIEQAPCFAWAENSPGRSRFGRCLAGCLRRETSRATEALSLRSRP